MMDVNQRRESDCKKHRVLKQSFENTIFALASTDLHAVCLEILIQMPGFSKLLNGWI